MQITIYSSVINFALPRNQRHPIFALNLFVGGCTPSSNLHQSEINKVSNFSVLIIKQQVLGDDKDVGNMPHYKTPGKTGEKT